MSTQDHFYRDRESPAAPALEQDKLVLPSLPEVAIKVQRLAADPQLQHEGDLRRHHPGSGHVSPDAVWPRPCVTAIRAIRSPPCPMP